MFDIKINDWDESPINLSPEEIAEPLYVLNDFFSSNWLPSHHEDLLRWRKFILADEHFTDEHGHVSSLLLSYKLNVKLVDVCYVILGRFKLLDKDLTAIVAKNNTQLAYERAMWRDYPNFLADDLLINPLCVLEEFFSAFSLSSFRGLMYEWLEAALSKNAIGEFMETSDIFAVYENLYNLYGAAWLIFQRLTDKPYLKVKESEHDKETKSAITAVANNNASLYKLDTIISSNQHDQIVKLVEIIRERVPSVQAIIYLGITPADANRMFLLVLTDNRQQGKAYDISNTLEESCKKIANVSVLVHHTASLKTATNEKNLFLKNAANCPVIYLSGGLILPLQKQVNAVGQEALLNWQRWFSQSQEFLKGAEYHLSIGAYNAAIFSLSQIAECLLIAVIKSVIGYDTNAHNLEKLLKLTQMFTGDIAAVFDLGNQEKSKLFDTLKTAYIDVRYRDHYEADPTAVSALYVLIKRMIMVVEQVNQKHLATSTL